MADSPYNLVSGSDVSLLNRNNRFRTAARDRFVEDNPLANREGRLSTNAGIAKDAYFANHSSRADGNQGLYDVLQTAEPYNAPLTPIGAESLWVGSRTSKGMFVQSDFLDSTGADGVGNNLTAAQQTRKGLQTFGFAFHYNPTTIDMAYQGLADIDYTMFTSGREAFNLLGTQATQSTISFNLVLNRMFDRRYFDNKTELLRNDVNFSDWSGRFPSDRREQREIYRKGTMYDIEFFLRTVMQVPISSYLKQRNSLFLAGSGRAATADIGFLTGVPVEIHLGKSLRYLVRVDTFNLKHIIFSEDMVPLFTEASITCSRIPDYAAENVGSGSTDDGDLNKPSNQAQTTYQVGMYSDGYGVDYTQPTYDKYSG